MTQRDVDLFRAIGGEKTCAALAEAFYARVPRDPVLRKVYGLSNHCANRAGATSPLLRSYFDRDRGALQGLLAIMSGSGSAELTSFVLETVSNSPELARDKYTYGRTLLHEATSEGSVTFVELLLKLGADPNAVDKFGHSPLYFAGNWCTKPTCGEIAQKLIQGAANPDAQDSVKRCTALHMAARRGNLSVAEALLDSSGEPRDFRHRG